METNHYISNLLGCECFCGSILCCRWLWTMGSSLTEHNGVPRAVKRQMAEQQLRARQMVLQQQAASAVAAASKTQREVCGCTWAYAPFGTTWLAC